MSKKKQRTSQALRDALFDELEELRSGNGDTGRALAVANLAKQIINIAKVEIDYHREAMRHAEAGHPLTLGSMTLGSLSSPAAPAAPPATAAPAVTTLDTAA